MAQQQWNYYVPPTNTASNVNTIVDSVKSAVNRSEQIKQQEKAEKERRRKENKRDAEITRNRNERQLDQQQNSMLMYNKDIRSATSDKGYVNSVLSKTYTIEDKREFANLSRQVATKECGACTEQLSRISEMKAEPGITKNFIELFSAEFEQMDTDIENNVFDKNNNSSLLALRGVLQGRQGYETGYDYGIRKLPDGSQELWITGPEGSIEPNRGKEYVINSKELGQAAENGGGVYASGYNINKELQSVDNSMRIIGNDGEPGVYKEEFFNEAEEITSKNGKELITVKTRNSEAAKKIYDQQITANATADFDNPASAIATWNTKLAKEEDDQWSYSEWEELSDDEKNEKRRLYEDRMREKFQTQIHTDFNKPFEVSRRDNPNYKEGDGSTETTQTIFEDMSSDLSSSFREAFPGMDNNIDIKGDIVTVNLASTDDDDEDSQTYDFTKKNDYVGFYTMLAEARGNFKGESDKIKKAKETFRQKVRAEWEKVEKENKAYRDYETQRKINVGVLETN
tara:strand:- start:3879 stop:5420 length:1542 start_codon:yes stop_codon:yes gene_type:complete